MQLRGCNVLIFFLDDMVIDHDDSVLPSESSPGPRVASNMFASSSDSSSRSSPPQANLKSKIGLVNHHPTMNGTFRYNFL